MFKRITIALERIANSLELLVAEYQEQKKEQKRFIEEARKERESIQLMDIFKQVQNVLTPKSEIRRQIDGN